MRTKLALLAAVAIVASLAVAPSANAKSSYILVTTKLTTASDFCRPSADFLSYKLNFKATIKRRNSPKPKSVRVTYKVIDNATGGQYNSGVVTLTPRNKFKNKSKYLSVPVGASITYNLVSTYRAPRTRKKVTAKAKIPDTIPTAAELDTAALPACA